MNGKRKRSEHSETKSKKESKEEKETKLDKYRIAPQTIEMLKKHGITELFPIQQETYDLIYDGKDIMGRDLTGSGKTLAYVLPVIERLRQTKIIDPTKKRVDKAPLVLVIVPTRELAIQVSHVFEQVRHGDEYKVLSVYGGALMEPQCETLRKGVEVVVGTTGRVMDHLERKTLIVKSLQCVVLDEADRMLDMGFQEDVEKIYEYIRGKDNLLPGDSKQAKAPVPKEPQSSPQCLLFSATYPSWVRQVSGKYLNPAFVFVDLVKNLRNKTASQVRHFAVFCPYFNRTSILADISKLFI